MGNDFVNLINYMKLHRGGILLQALIEIKTQIA